MPAERAKHKKQNWPPGEIPLPHLPNRLHRTPGFTEIQVYLRFAPERTPMRKSTDLDTLGVLEEVAPHGVITGTGHQTVKQQEQNEEIPVNRYETSIPRVACGIAAVAMTAITIGVSVVMPTKLESDSHHSRMVAASKVTTPAVTSVITCSASIDVVAVRELRLPAVPCASFEPPPRPESGVRRSPSSWHAVT